MKSLILILTFSCIAMTNIVAQINPLGLYVDIDGSVKFWRGEANYNGNLEDTVFISFNDETLVTDLRNFKYDYLTIVQAPRDNWTIPSNLDPSRINDTSSYSIPPIWKNTSFSPAIFFADSISLSTYVVLETTPTTQDRKFVVDEIRGDGLNDSVINLVKIKLDDLVDRYSGKFLPYEQDQQLRMEISYHDTVIEQVAIYDYIVDMIVTSEYDPNGLLSRGLGYKWDLGIEIDSLRYDRSNKLIYFSREYLGTNRIEYFFKYDKLGRVKILSERNRYPATENSIEILYERKIKFTYNRAGIMNSKADFQDGKWLTYQFEIKQKITNRQ